MRCCNAIDKATAPHNDVSDLVNRFFHLHPPRIPFISAVGQRHAIRKVLPVMFYLITLVFVRLIGVGSPAIRSRRMS
jgi:hypothetical protein